MLLIPGLSLLTACSSASLTDNPAQRYEGFTAQQLYVKGKNNLASRNYNQAVTLYEALESLYPFGGYAEKAQLDLIYAYYMSGEYASAEAASEQYIRVYPRSTNAAYAYYMKGLSNEASGKTWAQRAFRVDMATRDLTPAENAFYDFRTMVRLFPGSKYANDARQRMIALRNLFAKHEMEVADYYYKRTAYVAAANRASYVIKHYEHSSEVKNALVMLVKANRKLGLTKPANNALRILQLNYPGTKVSV